MGIQGLTSFIDHCGTFLTDYRFRNSKVVIDGSNIFHFLYFNSSVDQQHGGDFEDQVCKFFKALRDCGIEPYVIIDGGSDPTDKKFETLRKRAESKIDTANKLSKGLQGGRLIPTLARQVFKEVLSSLGVPFAQAIFEADQEIASLAQKWNCPVLSNDNDFYIFDIQAGFLPLSHFQWQNPSVQNYIPCKLYTTTSFCSQVNINRQLLPVFAAIAGNDYVNLNDMGFSIRWTDNSQMEPNRKPRVVFFNKLLKWLASFQEKQEALDNVHVLIGHGENNMDAALQALSRGIETYQIQPGCLERFFNDGEAPDPGLLPDHLRVLPDWTLLPLTNGTLPPYMIYILQRRPVIQGIQVEDHSLPSGNNTSRPIRQVFYGLLLGEGREVEEYDREGKNLTSCKVKAILPSAAQHLQLNMLNQTPYFKRLEVFLETLGVSQSTLNGVPPHLGLPVAVTYYWLRHAHPRPDLPLLQALLLGLVFGELCRQRKSQRGFIEEEPMLERMRGLIQRPAMSPDLGVAHVFSQWNRCMRDGLDLNQLLCLPLPEPQCAWLYKGTLVHQLVDQLRGGVTPDSLLMEDPSSVQLYRAMLDAMRPYSTSRKLRPLDNLTAPLQILSLEDEEFDDDDDDDDGVGWTEVPMSHHKRKERFNKALLSYRYRHR
ncbi:protein asteroid homolog 1 isoform X1 [Oncorhynchus tshawytscha]|uniref:protein asteroid homolog 1 isoform X1 n=1 Tax=Oncorhynchus tshawytscha TaxID=74940 RepID=UPI001C3E8336|nr:protein asteroid homolog 1 isoform X1 [Oncorhynchus tshawytscha]